MNARAFVPCIVVLSAGWLVSGGCYRGTSAPYDRPFPLGQVTDAHWDTQTTNAQASNFIFYDHEFVGETAALTPLGQKHLVQVALRLPHVPFPVVIEEGANNKTPKLDAERRKAVIGKLAQMGVRDIEQRVLVAPQIAEGITGREGERYYNSVHETDQGYGNGRGSSFGAYGGLR